MRLLITAIILSVALCLTAHGDAVYLKPNTIALTDLAAAVKAVQLAQHKDRAGLTQLLRENEYLTYEGGAVDLLYVSDEGKVAVIKPHPDRDDIYFVPSVSVVRVEPQRKSDEEPTIVTRLPNGNYIRHSGQGWIPLPLTATPAGPPDQPLSVR